MTINDAQQMTINDLTLHVESNQTRVEIRCNHAPLLEQIAEHARPLVAERHPGEAEICISINLWEAERKEFPLLRLAEDPEAVQVGKRLFRVRGGLLWRDLIRAKNMALFCRLNVRQLLNEKREATMQRRGIRLYRYGKDHISKQAPDAFKDIDNVLRVMQQFRIARAVARVRPLAVLKG